ncbi:hypothetical protein IYY11_08515 [Methylocystis sp. H62]|uniref:hypothetical protein n=1 Tax=Methylocystis sp. H62 TaxID=2785789 RepID=UPI0018C2D71E|nr:hypothetical protein [Methylocystis sp. H62]MBG0793423.1 hypothetical protein [Methylocystis sp. H62]
MDISSPASAREIEHFISKFGKRYIEALSHVRTLIVKARNEHANLACIYSIYSRGDKNGGNEIKHPRKIRLKHDKYCLDNNLIKSNVYSMPDIVGITISVTYPSDINTVCAMIDALCERKAVYPQIYDKNRNIEQNNNRTTKTIYGEVVEDNKNSYFACHYRLRMRNGSEEPIVEVQIKTILHDAWELKTHDLTYKNSFPVAESDKEHFALLGNVLSQLDRQSECLRNSIRRSSVLRDSKRSSVQSETIMLAASHVADKSPLPEAKAFVDKMRAAIQPNYVLSIGLGEVAELREEAISLYDQGEHACSSLFLSAVAALSGDNSSELAALERIDMWCSEKDHEKRIVAHQYAHIAHFCFGDIGNAIDIAESIFDEVETLCSGAIDSTNKLAALRKKNSIASSLSYYFAELIGADEGVKRRSIERAKYFSKISLECLVEMQLVPIGTSNWSSIIDAPFVAENEDRLFNSIDNAIFVVIQTAETAYELQEALTMLDLVKKKRPPSLGPLPDLLHDLHEHCARLRLLDCEIREIPAR